MLEPTITYETPETPANEVDRAFSVFQRFAGLEIVQAIQAILGTDEVGITLSPEYAAIKPNLPGFKRYPGKSSEQPLILTGDLHDHIVATNETNGVRVQVEDGHGIAEDGFDYAEYFQSGEGSTHGFAGLDYLGRGFDRVEDNFEERLLDVAFAALEL